MKKVLYLAAMLSLVLFGFSCTKPGGNRADSQTPGNNSGNEGEENGNGGGQNDEPEGPKVTTCDENLVLWISFDNDNLIEKGEGVSFKENKGDAAIKTGFIGKGWVNNAKDNKASAYSKFDVASDNVFKKIDKVTMTIWLKTESEKAKIKGCLFSLNGARTSDGKHHDWPALNVFFDNYGEVTIEDTGEKVPWQQINGRFTFHDNSGTEQNLFLNSSLNDFIYGQWIQLAVTYDMDTTGMDEESNQMVAKDQAKIYINGVLLAALTFDHKIPFGNLVTEACDAFYVGAWSTFVEGDSTQDWQNYWAGAIDEIRFYNKALSEEEITALYKEELNINLEQE